MSTNLILPWSSEYDDYLRDESRSAGEAESISFPQSESEIIEVVNAVRAGGGSLTTQGARTGIVAGAVPHGGHLLNLQRMRAIGLVRRNAEGGALTVQPGALLQEISPLVKAEGLFFPPDPTETSASIGGMVSCNSSGAMSFCYGPTRHWVRALRVVLSDGDILALTRGTQFARGRTFLLTTEGGRTISGTLPGYSQPPIKSAAGYYLTDDLDLLDLFIGMEGTLGIISNIELRLIPAPTAVLGVTAFLPDEAAALRFVRALRGEAASGFEKLTSRPVAIEYFNADVLELLRRLREEIASFEKIPALRPHFHTAVYTEFHGDSEDALEETMLQVLDMIVALGGNEDDTWCATTPRELEPLKAFRHAPPEAVNHLIGERQRRIPALTKLGTDMSAPDSELEAMMAMYHDGLRQAGLQSVIFGHIGNNHVHVNILPETLADYARGKALYLSWAEQILAHGGAISAEHGIGKLKIPFLRLMYGEEGIAQMRALKRLFDPQMMLNPGTLFEA